MYGDFEPPFYHFSKGLGFEEIYRLHENHAFNEYGEIEFARNHKYKLPPYLKDKLGYKTNPQFYSDSVYKWAEEKGFKNIQLAQDNRCKVVENTLIRKSISRGKIKLDLSKAEKSLMLDRLNRFEGFQDYDILDNILLAK